MKRILFMLCALHSQGLLADTKITCPDIFPANLLTVKGVPEQWKGIAHIPGPGLGLLSAGVIAGSPHKSPQGIQRGIERKTKKGREIEFPALYAFAEPLEKWVYCAYGSDGEVQLLQQLPGDTKTCKAEFTKTSYGNYRISTTCK